MGAQKAKLTAAMVSVFVATASSVAAAADAGLTAGDRDFVNKAAQGNTMEVQAGKLASQRALDPAVRSFAQQMVSDHSAANEKLKSLADQKQMPLAGDVSPAEHEELGKLEGLNGTEFDKAYSKLMVTDHTQDISEFEKALKKATDPDVKAYAQETLPTLRHHLMLANRLSSAERKSP
jgi:putative membrane protein